MPSPVITYPLDLTGNAATNLVTDELHSVNESKFKDYNFIIPNFSPLYTDGFKATIILNGVERDLVEDVDFSFALQYVTGTRTTGKVMYGGITLHSLSINGIIKLKYQTVGGDQISDRLSVLTLLAEKAYNPRTTIWDILTDAPAAFPPVPHYQDYTDFYGQEQVVTALNDIKNAILQNSSLTAAEIQTFLNNITGMYAQDYVRKSGDTMTGFLSLNQDPIENTHAATKGYVDSSIINLTNLNQLLSNYYTRTELDVELSNKISKSGDTMVGFLTLNADPTDNLHAATKKYTDTLNTGVQNQIDNIVQTVNAIDNNYVGREEFNSAIAELLSLIRTY